MKAYFGRRYMLSASHRLHSESLSTEENREAYGKCNNPHGHGHNYVIEVLTRGPVDAETGMVMNLTDLDEVVQTTILERFDHTNLNLDPLFANQVPTTENLCRAVFRTAAKRRCRQVGSRRCAWKRPKTTSSSVGIAKSRARVLQVEGSSSECPLRRAERLSKMAHPIAVSKPVRRSAAAESSLAEITTQEMYREILSSPRRRPRARRIALDPEPRREVDGLSDQGLWRRTLRRSCAARSLTWTTTRW